MPSGNYAFAEACVMRAAQFNDPCLEYWRLKILTGNLRSRFAIDCQRRLGTLPGAHGADLLLPAFNCAAERLDRLLSFAIIVNNWGHRPGK